MADPNVMTTEAEFQAAIQPIETLIERQHTPDELRTAVDNFLENYQLDSTPQIERGIIYTVRDSIELLTNTPAIEAVSDVRNRLLQVVSNLDEMEQSDEDTEIPGADDETDEIEEAPTASEPIIAVLKNSLKDPSLITNDPNNIQSPAILAAIRIINQENYTENDLMDCLASSAKIPKASAKALLEKYRKKGIRTPDDLDEALAKAKTKLRETKSEAQDLKIEIDQIVQIRRKELSDTEQKTIEQKQKDYRAKNKEVLVLEQEVEELENIAPFLGISRMTPEELLYKIVVFKKERDGETDLLPEDISEHVDQLIQSEQIKGIDSASGIEKITQLVKPSLKATILELTKSPQLKEVDPKDLIELVKNRKNTEYLSGWIESLDEKAKRIVPTLMAYLSIALTHKDLNKFSQASAKLLLENLRKARNMVVRKQINNNPELSDEKPQIKLQAYLKEISTWDENRISVNQDILKRLVTKSYLSKAGKAIVGGTAMYYLWPYIGFKAIGATIAKMPIMQMLGIGAEYASVPAYFASKKAVQTFRPEYEKEFKFFGSRVAGLLALGPIGLAAPELWKGTKFAFGIKKESEKGRMSQIKESIGGKFVAGTAKTTGKIAKGSVKPAWAITKGTAKIVTSPFRRKKAA